MVGRVEDERAASAAAAWYARRGRDEPGEADASRFRRWRAGHPAHEQAWRRVAEAGAKLDRVADQPEILSLIARARGSRPNRAARGVLWLGLAATLFSIGGGLLIHYGAAHLAGTHPSPRPSATSKA